MNKFTLFLVLVSIAHSCFGDQNDGSETKFAELFGTRILGGHETTIEEHPYQVLLNIKERYYCGGFIVSEDYIITAGHCQAKPSEIVVRAGSTYQNGTIIPIEEVMVHPDFNNPKSNNDVAVLKTAQKIDFSEGVKAIPLASEGRQVVTGSKISVSGWGRTEESETALPDHLMTVEVPVVEHNQCVAAYPTLVTEDQFCAGDIEFGGQDACRGDSGGAAVQDGVAVGIVSFGRGCGRPGSPSVYASIGAKSIRDFINEKTGL